MVEGGAGNHHAAGRRERLEARGDIHAVAVEVAIVLVDDVAEVDADAKADTLGFGDVAFPLGHAALDEHRAADRVDDAGELAQGAVAHQLDGAAAILGDQRVGELLAVRLEPGERAVLVALHQPREAHHVGRQDGRQPAIRMGSGQREAP